MTKKIAIVFPGQGSQSVGMLAGLAEAYPMVRETFAEGSEALGLDLWQLTQEGPVEALNQTENTQPAMLCAGISVLRALLSQGDLPATVMAGHSLGEYSALVAAGAIDLPDAVRLVATRGRLMQEAVPAGEGAMAAIIGLDDDAVRQVCTDAADGDVVEAVNFNAPGQVVIAGSAEAVTRATKMAKEAGAKRALKLDVSVPSHCALMRPAAERLAKTLAEVEIRTPTTMVLHNSTVDSVPSADLIRDRLAAQLFSPVRWVETVRRVREDGCELVIESGPGKVLAGLNRRIDKELPTVAVFDALGVESAMEMANA